MPRKPKIVYIVPSLKRCGPTNQLLMIVDAATRHFEVEVLLLKQVDQTKSMDHLFAELGAKVTNLNSNLISCRFKIAKHLLSSSPRLIHSQGFLPDFMLATLGLRTPWISSIRNYCWEDYPMKFGKLVGSLMAATHIWALGKADFRVSCSQYLKTKYSCHKINAGVIRNGVRLPLINHDGYLENSSTGHISVVGSLIKRKNNMPLVLEHNDFALSNQTKLFFIGDGPEMTALKSIAGKNIKFVGQVSDVNTWYSRSKLLISNSLSEGMPNSVLEALSHGLRCLLSRIEPHSELALEFPKLISFIESTDDPQAISQKMLGLVNSEHPGNVTRDLKKISHSLMAAKYLGLYKKVIGR